MQNKKATLVNIFAALITLGVQMFISFWLSPFVVGKLGEEAYGFINLANNFVAALGYFTLFFITFDKNEKREFVKIIKDKLSNE